MNATESKATPQCCEPFKAHALLVREVAYTGLHIQTANTMTTWGYRFVAINFFCTTTLLINQIIQKEFLYGTLSGALLYTAGMTMGISLFSAYTAHNHLSEANKHLASAQQGFVNLGYARQSQSEENRFSEVAARQIHKA